MEIFIAIIVIAALIGLIVYFSRKHNKKSKGELGEEYVAHILGKTIPGKQYIINDLIIDHEDGMTSQLDHIFINKNGIWVIETKNYAGSIYGVDNQQEWTQVINYGKEKRKFYNPIKQNETHIYWLKKVLHPKTVVHSLVVFVDSDISHVNATNVINSDRLKKTVWKDIGLNLSTNEMELYYQSLLFIKEKNTISTEEHIENIHKMQENIENNICPRCGGNLVIRHGQSGDFLGCENYPKCKFTKKL